MYAKSNFDINMAKEIRQYEKEFAALYDAEEAKKKAIDEQTRLESERKA